MIGMEGGFIALACIAVFGLLFATLTGWADKREAKRIDAMRDDQRRGRR